MTIKDHLMWGNTRWWDETEPVTYLNMLKFCYTGLIGSLFYLEKSMFKYSQFKDNSQKKCN